MYLRLACALVAVYTYGGAILYLLGYELRGLLKKPYLLFCFGTGGMSFFMFLAAFFSMRLSLKLIIFGVVLLLCLCALKLLLQGTGKRGWVLFEGRPYSNIRGDTGRWYKIVRLLCAAAIVIQIICLFMICLEQPENSWDSLAYWSPKAKILYTQQNIYGNTFDYPRLVHKVSNYPLLVPLGMSNIYFFLGQINDRLVRLLFLFYFIMFILAFFDTLRRYVPELNALIFTAFFSTIPRFLIGGGSAADCAANIPLAFYCFIAAVFFMRYLKERRFELIIPMALLLFFCAFTKSEGFYYGIIFIIGSMLFARNKADRGTVLKDLIFLIAAFLALYAPWFMYKTIFIALPHINFPSLIRINYFLAQFHRLSFVIPMLIFEGLKVWHWHIAGIIFIISVIYTVKSRVFQPEILYLWFIMLAFFVFFAFAYMLSTWWGSGNDEVCKEFIRSSGSGLYFSLMPLALLVSSLSFC